MWVNYLTNTDQPCIRADERDMNHAEQNIGRGESLQVQQLVYVIFMITMNVAIDEIDELF